MSIFNEEYFSIMKVGKSLLSLELTNGKEYSGCVGAALSNVVLLLDVVREDGKKFYTMFIPYDNIVYTAMPERNEQNAETLKKIIEFCNDNKEQAICKGCSKQNGPM